VRNGNRNGAFSIPLDTLSPERAKQLAGVRKAVAVRLANGNNKDAPRCKATSKRTGLRCGSIVKQDGDVCQWHGGASLKGVLHPLAKGGMGSRYEKVLPQRMVDGAEAALNDPELLNLSQELDVAQKFLADAIDRCDKGASGEIIDAIKEAVIASQKCVFAVKQNPADPDKWQDITDAGENLLLLVNNAEADYAARREMREWMETIRKLQDSEVKRRKEINATMSAVEVRDLLAAFILDVKRELGGREEYRTPYAKICRAFDNRLALVVASRVGPGAGQQNPPLALGPVDTDQE
jgi:tRNA-dihydrouridine synthase